VANPKSTSESEVRPEDRVGSVVKGKWTIEALLGVGGMAAVYAASHRNGQRAALKILHAEFSRDKSICERFLREGYVSNKVNHGATVQVLDDDMADEGEPFLVMELLEGETVRDAWKRAGKTMPAERVLQICERVLDCLASCHAIKVIHRDLKPANIFLHQGDDVRVLDFGVAQMRDATSERTATGTALGTPAYMSPEQAMGLVDQLDGRADLFSVGAMMHALITGHRINHGRTEQEALVMAATKPVPSLARIAPQLSVELIRLIDKALAWDRRSRFQDAREMQRALLELMPSLGATPLVSRPPPRPLEVVAPPGPSPSGAPKEPSARPPVPAVTAAAIPATSPPSGVPIAKPSTVPAVKPSGPPVTKPSGPPVTGRAVASVPFPRATAPSFSSEEFRVQTLRELMKHIDRVLPSVRQLGWRHPATERVLVTAHEAFTAALAEDARAIDWSIRPYSFLMNGQTVWEPLAPFDAVPYNLFASGVRTLRLLPGVSLEEFRALLALVILDPGRELPPEDDLATALWERSLTCVTFECADAFADGDAATRESFYGEADQLEGLAERAAHEGRANRLEVQAMAVATDASALGSLAAPSPFELDQASRQALDAEFHLSKEAWSERFVDALVEGYLDSAASRDAGIVLLSLRRSAADLVVAERLGVVEQIHDALIARLRERVQNADNCTKLCAALTNAMFGGDTLALMLKALRADVSSADALRRILPQLSPSEMVTVMGCFREVESERSLEALAPFIEAHAPGFEAELANAAMGATSLAGAYLVHLLARMRTTLSQQLLAQLALQTEDVTVQVEAKVLLASTPEQAQRELAAFLDGGADLARIAALRIGVRSGMRGLWPSVAKHIAAKTFLERGTDERRELLKAALLLSPEQGEPVLLDFLKKGGVLSSEDRESTRTMAAAILGEFSRSRATALSLQEISTARWGVSEETKLAASHAAARIGERLARGSMAG
jgi:serine/threonine protein kinase